VTDAADTLPPADRRSAFANAPMGIALATPAGLIVDANPALAAMLAYTTEELYGRSMLDLVHPDNRAAAVEAFAELLEERRMMRHETRLVRADGGVVPVQVASSWVDGTPDGDPPHVVAIVEDITDRKALEAALVHRSLHDPLTGLPNRILFNDRLHHALERGRRERTPTSLLGIDLDGFKQINDTLGHAAGDALLMAVATRLRDALRAGDNAARLGGDEFAILLPDAGGELDVRRVAERAIETLQQPLDLHGHEVIPSGSVGVAVARGADITAAELLQAADADMYALKQGRKGGLRVLPPTPAPADVPSALPWRQLKG
jgi:diguanylate cyclase (GGDEF)-like protein/PAS domain S-box-containing protein